MNVYRFLNVLGFGCLTTGSALILFAYAAPASLAAPDTALAATAFSTSTASFSTTTPDVPVSLTIPSISLGVSVIPVGVTAQNAVDVPNTLKLAGWFTQSAIPGNVGSALIDGHVGNNIGTPGVFANLHKLLIGDSIYVTEKNGMVERFVVTQTQVYPLADVPMSAILENTDEHRLNIITCAGSWVPTKDTFDHRLVVYTELAS